MYYTIYSDVLFKNKRLCKQQLFTRLNIFVLCVQAYTSAVAFTRRRVLVFNNNNNNSKIMSINKYTSAITVIDDDTHSCVCVYFEFRVPFVPK